MTQDDKDFSVGDAFDQLMADGGYSDTEPTQKADTDVVDTATNANASTDTTNNNTLDSTSTDSISTDQDSGDKAPDQDVDWKAEAAKLEQKFKSYDGRMQAELARRRDEEESRQRQYMELLARVSTPNQQTQQQVTVEQASKFKQLREDFPEIAEAVEELIQSRLIEAHAVVKNEISSRIDPVVANLGQTQADSHRNRIVSKHPDAMEIGQSKEFESWVTALPSFAQTGAMHVIKLGTAEEVVALLDQYKSSINKNQTQNTVKPTNENNTTTNSANLVAALKSGLAVKGGKSLDPNTNTTSKDPNDFDQGWEDAVKQFGIK